MTDAKQLTIETDSKETSRPWDGVRLPMVEVFETIEGEGTQAGYMTTFVRVFNCNLRCAWCDTPYSYAPEKPAYYASIAETADHVKTFANPRVCLTGGEPLMHGEKSRMLLRALAELDSVEDIHVETNGAIDLSPFRHDRETYEQLFSKVRFIVDYKLPSSGEMEKMVSSNFACLGPQDEVKFVIGSRADFDTALSVLITHYRQGYVLFSPVFESMPAEELAALMIEHRLKHVKLNVQIHKYIWDPHRRGV